MFIAAGIIASEGRLPLFPPVFPLTPYPPLSPSRDWNNCENLTLSHTHWTPGFLSFHHLSSPLESPHCLWYSHVPPFFAGSPANDAHGWMKRNEEGPELQHSEVLICNLGGFILKGKNERFRDILSVVLSFRHTRS